MEAYALLALGGIGLFAARKQFSGYEGNPTRKAKPVQGNVPSVNSMYAANHVQKVQNEERKAVTAMATLATLPLDHGGVLPRSSKRLPPPSIRPVSQVRSHLAGVDIPAEHFTHNNMTPFLKGDVKQNLNPLANSALLETMTGNDGFFRPGKQETQREFPSEKNVGNMYGTPVSADTWRDRIVLPTLRNNEFPVAQVHVGPGINKGYTSLPSDGYFDQREYNMPRGTDDIRAANKPKLTFDGRILPGQAPQRPADVKVLGVIEKNRPETTMEMPDGWNLPTTGAFLKDKQRPAFENRVQAREGTTREYAGTAFAANTKDAWRPDAGAPRTQNLASLNPGPAAAANWGSVAADDKGKASIQVYGNSRDVTTTKVYQGNVASLVKSITAPLLDMVKPTRAACPHVVYNPREDGNIKGPSRIRVYDPDDVMKATMKQTLLQESQGANLRGPSRMIAYDPDDIAKATLKQTMLQESQAANLRGPSKISINDPNDIARATLKETMLQESQGANLRGPSKIAIHDPNDVMRTTLKQTMLQESQGTNLRGPSKITINDPNDVMRTTLKQTTLQESHGANVASHTMRGQVYTDEDAKVTLRDTLDEEDAGNIKSLVPNSTIWDPEDVLKGTMKQTLIDAEREAGNPDGLERRRGAYMTTEYEAKRTQKEAMSDSDYYGQGARDLGEGYATAPVDLRPAAKAVLSDNDYYGGAADASRAQTSHENYDNAVISEIRELLLEGREPTNSSVKVSVGAEDAGVVEVRKQLMSDGDDRRLAAQPREVLDVLDMNVTHDRHIYNSGNRLDDDAAANHAQLDDNPFNLRLSS